MRTIDLLTAAAVLLAGMGACQDPDCQDDEQKVGKTCLPKSQHSRDASTPSEDSGDRTTMPSSDATAASDAAPMSEKQRDGAVEGSSASSDGGSVGCDGDAALGSSTACDTCGPPSTEVCDGHDNDCDGRIDEDSVCASALSVTAISVGARHACGLLSDRTIKCWGDNRAGQLGAAVADQLAPTLVAGVSSVVQVSAGDEHTCARRADGSIVCWGSNAGGELGIGTFSAEDSVLGVQTVQSVNDATYLAAGVASTCVVHKNGGVSCWGGWGTDSLEKTSVPQSVAELATVATMGAGHLHLCAVLTSGEIECWGDGQSGELGNGAETDSTRPVYSNVGVFSASTVAVGLQHTCAAGVNGSVECWGTNTSGQLGLGSDAATLSATVTTPTLVPDLDSVRSVSAGPIGTCALLMSGGVSCWGQVISGTGSPQHGHNTPTPVSAIATAVEVDSGDGFSCARLSEGNVKCWGFNEQGQLGGASSAAYSDAPVEVPLL